MATHSRADRIGMGIFVATATGLIGAGLFWLCSLAYGHWWFWPLATLATIAVAVLAGTGISAVIARGRFTSPRATGISPEAWVKGPQH